MRFDLPRLWYQPTLPFHWRGLILFSWLFSAIVSIRRFFYRIQLFKSHKITIPVIVVGNITVGGTGKTPFVIHLANWLKEQGYRPGIATRGVGGMLHRTPYLVTNESTVSDAGDEAMLHQRHAGCPVVICKNRVLAAEKLQAQDCDIVICDDGLSHYALSRDIEIVMVDSERQFGNGYMLPAGPLREPITRLREVDIVVCNGKTSEMRLLPEAFISITDATNQLPLHQSLFQKVHAVAGIGNPDRFFNQLRALGLEVIPHVFPDHHPYVASDLAFGDDLPIVMTEKDAVKCAMFSLQQGWYLRVSALVHPDIHTRLLNRLKKGSSSDGVAAVGL